VSIYVLQALLQTLFVNFLISCSYKRP